LHHKKYVSIGTLLVLGFIVEVTLLLTQNSMIYAAGCAFAMLFISFVASLDIHNRKLKNKRYQK
jgi:hypothetical protein